MSAIYECECDSFEMYEEQDSFEMAEAVPGLGVPSGGLTGQVLKKRSDEDFDTEWADESGGGGGTSDYTQLSNKPQINGNTLAGNKTGTDLGLVNAVPGKQLSTEDYTAEEKTKLSGIEAQANKTVIDSTLTNAGQAADAKKTGDELTDLRNTLNQLEADAFGSINLTGTNNTGSTITAGTFFYNNGSLVRAKTDIQNGSAITIGTNAETVTAGGLNSLNDQIVIKSTTTVTLVGTVVKTATKEWKCALSFPFRTKDTSYTVAFGQIYLMNVGNMASGVPTVYIKGTSGIGVAITGANGAENYPYGVISVPVTISW